MCRFHLARYLVVPLFCGLSDCFTLPNELVPINPPTSLVDHGFSLRVVLLPFGRPPSLPHSRIRRLNSALPHFLARASALRLPMRLAALLASVGCFRFMPRIVNLTLGYCQGANHFPPKCTTMGVALCFLIGYSRPLWGKVTPAPCNSSTARGDNPASPFLGFSTKPTS